MAYRQYLDTRHFNMPWKNVAIQGFGATDWKAPASNALVLYASIASVVVALAIDHFLDKARMTPNAARGYRRKDRRYRSKLRPGATLAPKRLWTKLPPWNDPALARR